MVGPVRVVRCCLWWRRCWWAGLILIMLIGCGRVPPKGCCRLGDGPFHVGYVPSFVHMGSCPPVGQALGETLKRVWSVSGEPAPNPVTVDVDSTICEVWGKNKQDASYGYTKQLEYHPLVAVRADTGEIVHSRLRKGSSQGGNVHFVVESVNRVRRVGAARPVTVRADAGFWSYDLIKRLDRLRVRWSITIRQYAQIKPAVSNIEETEWTTIDYPKEGVAQVAETTVTASSRGDHRRVRVVVRRTRLTDPAQAQLWPHWRYHTFATNTELSSVEADAYHRAHARAELAIRDLKHAGLSHCPSGSFFANAAWLGCTVLAHNLYRWIEHVIGVTIVIYRVRQTEMPP